MWIIDLLNYANLQQFTSIKGILFTHGALGFLSLLILWRVVTAKYLLSFSDLIEKTIFKLLIQEITVLGYLEQKRKKY